MVTWLKRGYTYLVLLFLYAPIFVLMVLSFSDSRTRGSFDSFSLRWYKELFQDRQIMTSLYYTFVIGLLSAVCSTVLGTFAALQISKLKGVAKSLVMNITYIPVLNPEIVTGISLMVLFVFLNLRLGFVTLLLSHITFNLPYVVLSVLPKIRQLDGNTYEAAEDLGASPLFAFWKVILPQILPGVLTGFLLAFTLSIDDFVISFFTTGSGVSTLSITIYSMARRGINPKINALSTLIFLTVLILLLVVNVLGEKNRKDDTNAKKKKQGKRPALPNPFGARDRM